MRKLSGPVSYGVSIWLAGMAMLHFWFTIGGYPPPLELASLHLMLAVPPVFLLYPATPKSPVDRPTLIDWGLSFLAVRPSLYIYLQNELLIAKAATILNSDLSFFINHPNSIDLNKMLGQFTEAVGVLKTTENSNVESNVCDKIKTFYLHVQSALVVKISEVFEKPNKKTDVCSR